MDKYEKALRDIIYLSLDEDYVQDIIINDLNGDWEGLYQKIKEIFNRVG